MLQQHGFRQLLCLKLCNCTPSVHGHLSWRCVLATGDSIRCKFAYKLFAMQVDSSGNADSTAGPPAVSEAEVKEAWLASCRAIYEVQPKPATCNPPVLLASSAVCQHS